MMSRLTGREKLIRFPTNTAASTPYGPIRDESGLASEEMPETGSPLYLANFDQMFGTLSASNPTARSGQLLQLQHTHGNRFVLV